jgi:hypothetical protein
VLVLGLAFAGCATQREVAQIVANSNAAMLASRFDLAVAPGGDPGASAAAVQQEFDRIEAFVAAHADPQFLGTTTPLRLRQAVLLLNAGQLNLAKAAFAQVDGQHLHTARDQALLRSKDTLLWWFGSSKKANWDDADRSASKQAMAQLQGEQERLGDSPDVRDYLAEMRAWIGIVAAKHTLDANKLRSHVKDALDGYAKIFTADDLQALDAATAGPNPPQLGPELRRRVRSKAVLDQARDINRQLAAAERVHVDTPAFEQRINP